MVPELHLLLLTCQQEDLLQESKLHSTNASEEMDITEPALASYHGSPTDRGKRASQSPVLSPTKAPLYKKQHWDAPGRTQHQDSSHESLAAHPASDQPASEHTLKHMLLSLQRDLRSELSSSISSLHSRIDQVEE